MAYYYVKNGGTATGDAGRYAIQQTGSFTTLGAANYYTTVTAAIAATTPPTSGDFIYVSDTTTITDTVVTGEFASFYCVVSVDDVNIDSNRTAGNRATLSSGNVTLKDICMSGIKLSATNDVSFQGNVVLYDCELTVPSSFDRVINLQFDGASVSLTGGVLFMGGTGTLAFVEKGGSVTLDNIVVETLTAGVDAFFSGGFGGGGGAVKVTSSDLTSITGTLIAGVGLATSSAADIRLDMCQLATGVAFTNNDFRSPSQRALFTRCSDSSAAAEYQYHLHAFGGDVNDDSAIYRNEDEPFTDSGQKISYEIVTNSDASLGSPLWLDFPILRYSKLSVGATDTLRFYLTSDTALTDKDVYIEIAYPDGTNKQTPNFLSSAPTTVGGTLDIMATGTTLVTDVTSTWTGGLSNNYQIDLNTSVDVGSDCLPIVKVYITKPSVTIQLASEFGLI